MADEADHFVKVMPEWALHGKEPYGAAYQLLNSSHGVLSRENFEIALDRYSPGTLEDLPQVTISWFEDKAVNRRSHAADVKDYVGFAIHKRPTGNVVDVGGREFVQTSYFCVDFRVLAGPAVSYCAMYEGFRAIELPPRGRASITAKLSAPAPQSPTRQLAVLAAALLLTDKPVCVLGADRVHLSERLRFIDDVAALLPYGMRSRLSASTWTSSTYRTHNFRLFFTSAKRNTDDHILSWNTNPPASTGLHVPDDYIAWLLSKDISSRVRQLANEKDQMAFSWAQVQPVMRRLGVIPDRRGLVRGVTWPQQVGGSSERETLQLEASGAENLILDIAASIRNKQSELVDRSIAKLESHIGDPLTSDERKRYRHLIKEHQLLRENLALPKPLRVKLYSVLLRLAFAPLKYQTYCAIEECVNEPYEQPVHQLLAEVAYGITKIRAVQLLALRAMDETKLRSTVHSSTTSPREWMEMISLPGMQLRHAKFICDMAFEYLESRSGVYDQDTLRAAFQPSGYLADLMHDIYADDPDGEFNELTRLLRIVYKEPLDPVVIEDILDNSSSEPSTALCAAVVGLVDPRDVEEAVWRAFYGHIRGRRFSADTAYRLIARLNDTKPRKVYLETSRKPRRRIFSWFSGDGVIAIVIAVTVIAIIYVFAKILPP